MIAIVGASSRGTASDTTPCPFDEIIANTALAQTRPAETTREPMKWPVGTDNLSVEWSNGKLNLLGAKSDVSVAADLTPQQIQRAKKFTIQSANSFHPNFSKDGHVGALKSAINYSKLHSAFYDLGAEPIEAARELAALIKRASSNNPHMTVKISKAPTQDEKLRGINKLVGGLEAAAELHAERRLAPVLHEIKKHSEEELGAVVLGGILGNEPKAITLDRLTENTDRLKAAMNPEAVELSIDYSHDTPATLHLERTGQGHLKITTNAGVGVRFNDLKSLVEWLQGTGFSGNGFDWRTYEKIDSTPFLIR